MNYHNITKDDMLNGDGLRTVLWVSGCRLHCKNCQNPETWDYNSGILFDDKAEKELFDSLNHDYISGITFSGGHPLDPNNYQTVLDLCKKFRSVFDNSKTIWIYTGYTWEQVKDLEIMQYIDVLVDGAFIEELKDEKLYWRGSSNQRVVDVQKTLQTGQIVLHCN